RFSASRHDVGVMRVRGGVARPDDRIRGPDERLHLPTFFRAIETSLALWEELGARDPRVTLHGADAPRVEVQASYSTVIATPARVTASPVPGTRGPRWIATWCAPA